MKDATGRELKVGDIVWYQSYTHITPFTPHKLAFVRTVNGWDRDPAGLFRFAHVDSDLELFCHWWDQIWPTKNQAIDHAIKNLERIKTQLLAMKE